MPTISEMLYKLNVMYDEEEHLIKEMKKLKARYEQLQEDKEMMQNFIMYESNKIHRGAQSGNINQNQR